MSKAARISSLRIMACKSAASRTMICCYDVGELRDLLVELSDETRVASAQGMDTVALNLVTVAWFISMKFSNALNIGIYEGDDHRLVGTE